MEVCVRKWGERIVVTEVEEARSSDVRQHSERKREVNVEQHRRHDDDVVVLGQQRGHFNHPGFHPQTRTFLIDLAEGFGCTDCLSTYRTICYQRLT
jgi:hypothetical protein